MLKAGISLFSVHLIRQMQSRANQFAHIAWCSTFFFITFSTALGLLFSALAVVTTAVGFSLDGCKKAISKPTIALCLVLFIWISISAIWSIAPKAELIEGWSKYRKLLYPLLIFMVLSNVKKTPSQMLDSFLLSCGLISVFSISSAHGLIELILGPPKIYDGWYVGPGWLLIGNPENPTFGRNHITQSTFLTLAAMLCLGRAWNHFHTTKITRKIVMWIFFAATLLYVVSLLQARTGYLLSALLLIFWIIVVWSQMSKKYSVVITLVACVTLVSAYITNPMVVSRTTTLIQSISDYKNNMSINDGGVRIAFWKIGLEGFSKKPIIGHGVGSYAQAYSKAPDKPIQLPALSDNAHSEYVMLLVQGGIIALTLFMLIILASVHEGSTLFRDRPEHVGLLLLFFASASFNSNIWDLAEGHFFALLLTASISPWAVRKDKTL